MTPADLSSRLAAHRARVEEDMALAAKLGTWQAGRRPYAVIDGRIAAPDHERTEAFARATASWPALLRLALDEIEKAEVRLAEARRLDGLQNVLYLEIIIEHEEAAAAILERLDASLGGGK